jgi:hypothetical protein
MNEICEAMRDALTKQIESGYVGTHSIVWLIEDDTDNIGILLYDLENEKNVEVTLDSFGIVVETIEARMKTLVHGFHDWAEHVEDEDFFDWFEKNFVYYIEL